MSDDIADDDFGNLEDLPEVNVGEDSEVDPFYCSECDKTFKNQHGKNIHDARMHGISNAGSDSAPAGHKARKGDLEKQLAEFFMTAGLMISMADTYDGMIIAQNSQRLAASWAHLAATNKTVDKALRSLVTASTFGEVLASTIAVVIPIMVHHQLIVLPENMQTMFVPPSPESFQQGDD